MMRFTLFKAFVAITFVALACAGMMYRNAGWASGLITLSLLLFTAMALRAIGLRGPDRAFALAFAAVGCGYLLLATSTIFSGIRESLFTNYPLAYAARALQATHTNHWTSYPAYSTTISVPSISYAPAIPSTNFSLPNVPSIETPDEVEESGVGRPTDPGEPAQPPSEFTEASVPTPVPNAATTAIASGGFSLQAIPAYPAAPYGPSAAPIEAVIAEATTSLQSAYSPYGGMGNPSQKFFQIGHCVWSWLFALLAGWFAAWMYGRKSARMNS